MTGAQYPVPDAALALDLSAVAQAAASGLLFVDAGRPAGPVGRMARVFAPTSALLQRVPLPAHWPRADLPTDSHGHAA
jgi:hypothetical protein